MQRELPEGWEWKKLGDLIELKYGDGLKGDKREASGKIPVYGSNGVVGHHDKSLTNGPCLIIGRKGSIGEVHLSLGPCWPIDTTYFVESKPEIDLKFLFYLLKTLRLNSLDRSTAIPGLNRNDVYSKIIPLPPLPVQRQIVAVLEQAEAVGRQRKEADALTGALLQSVFLEMFGNPENNSKKWGLVKLGDVSKVVVSYVGPINQYFCEKEEGVPLLNTTNIKPDGLISNDFRYVTREFHKKNKKSQLHPGDIIMARHGKSGSATIIPDSLLEAQSINNVIIKRSTELEPDYVRHLFNLSTHSQKLLGLKTGTVQKIINTKQLADFKIPLPPLALQQQFAQIVERVERIRDQQVASGKETEGLCEGLMQRAFKGELSLENT